MSLLLLASCAIKLTAFQASVGVALVWWPASVNGEQVMIFLREPDYDGDRDPSRLIQAN